MSYDILAVRAQREEATGAKPWTFNMGKEKFTLPSEPPAELLPFLGELAQFLDGFDPESGKIPTELVTAVPGILEKLLGPADHERLAKFRLSIQDVTSLLITYVGETTGGGGLGESAPSPTSSPATRRTQKRTSKGTTASSSARTTAAS